MAVQKITRPKLDVSRFGFEIDQLVRALGVSREEAESRFEKLCHRVGRPAPFSVSGLT